MLPPQHLFDYWNLNVASDIFLDTPEWSGGNTSLEAVACGLPIVTLPGKMMRARHSFAILTSLGVTETVASDEQQYVDIAVRLALEPSWRAEIVERMRRNCPVLYDDLRPVRALEEFFEQALRD